MAEQQDELVITLRKPLSIGGDAGVQFTELKLREPTAGEWMQWDKLAGIEADVKAVSIVSGVPEPAIRQMGARDLTQAAGFIASFLSAAPQTPVA